MNFLITFKGQNIFIMLMVIRISLNFNIQVKICEKWPSKQNKDDFSSLCD